MLCIETLAPDWFCESAAVVYSHMYQVLRLDGTHEKSCWSCAPLG